MNVGKMAILDALDAATGEYLFSVDAGTQNVITRIDPKTGAKTIDPKSGPIRSGRPSICPGVSGARSWPPTSYSPQTALLYLPLTEWCMSFGPEGFKLLTSGVGLMPAEHPDAADGKMGRLQAIDVAGRKLAWVHHQRAPLLDLGAGDGRRRGLRRRPRSVAEGVRRRDRQAAVAGRARRLAELEHHHLQRRPDAVRRGRRRACATTTSTICRGRTAPSARTEVRLSRRSGAAPRSGSSRSSPTRGGFAPSDSPTRSLARRCAGALPPPLKLRWTGRSRLPTVAAAASPLRRWVARSRARSRRRSARF